MNRRTFIKSLFTVAVATQLELDGTLDKLVEATVEMNESEIVTYITSSFNLYIDNPGCLGYIDGITE